MQRGSLRTTGLCSESAISWLAQGVSFVCPAHDILSPDSPLLGWHPSYLRRHLPKAQTFPVFFRGTEKLVMSHTMRYTKCADRAEMQLEEPDERFTRAGVNSLLTSD